MNLFLSEETDFVPVDRILLASRRLSNMQENYLVAEDVFTTSGLMGVIKAECDTIGIPFVEC